MDYQDTVNFTSNSSDITYEQSRRYILHEIVFTIFCIIGLCADVVIIYTIVNFKRIRTPSNIYLANWAAVDICSLILTPSSYGLTSVLLHKSLSFHMMCILFQYGSILHFTVILFVLMTLTDWYLSAYFKRASEKYRRVQLYIIGAMWTVPIIIGTLFARFCVSHYFYGIIPMLMLFSSFCGVLLLIIILQIVRGIQKCRKKPLEHPTVILTIATGFVITWLLGFFNMLLLDFLRIYHPMLMILSACAIFSSSLVNLTLLYRLDKDFQACLLQIFRRSRNRYEDTISEADADNVNDQYSVSFHNPTEELLTNAY